MAKWDGSTTKEGKVIGVMDGAIATIPSGTTNTIYAGWAVEISDDSGVTSTSGIGVEKVSPGVFTTYKNFAGTVSLTGTFYTPRVGDICVATSTTIVIKKNTLR